MAKRKQLFTIREKKRMKFLIIDGELLIVKDKLSETILKCPFSSEQGVYLLKIFTGKPFLKFSKSTTIKVK